MADGTKLEVDENGYVTGVKLVTNDFVGEALLTLSPSYHGDMVARVEFITALTLAIDALERLDKIKKTLFYGKDNGIGPREGASVDMSAIPMYIRSNNYHEYTKEQAELIIHGVLGVATESGELLEALRTAINGNGLDRVNFMEESGDTKWYLAILAQAFGYAWTDDEDRVIAKLRKRFPERFTEYDANNRNLEVERMALEGVDDPQLALPISHRQTRMQDETHIPPHRTDAEKEAAYSRYEAGGGYIPGESVPIDPR